MTAFSRLLGDGGYACLGRLTLADCAAMPSLWRLLHAGALRRARAAAGVGGDGRRAPRLGAGRSRERDSGVITSRANSRVKAARALGEAKERKRTGLFVDEGEDALRAALAAGIAPVEAFVDDDLGSDRIADELAAAGTKVLRCTAEVMAALSSLSHTSRAVGVLRANDLPPLVAGSPAERGRAAPPRRVATPATSARCCAARRASAPRTWRWPRAAPIRSRRAPCAPAWARSTRCR